jgi:hypothetical protein
MSKSWRRFVLLCLTASACAAAPDGDGPDEGDPAEQASGASTEVAIVRNDGDFLAVKNQDGVWWIAKRCIAKGESKTVDFGTGKGHEKGSVGPGHIFRAHADIDGNGSLDEFVNDWSGGELPWNGLLGFAYHHIQASQGSVAMPNVDQGGNAKSVASRLCASDSLPSGFGAGATSNGAGGPPEVSWQIKGRDLKAVIATEVLAFGQKFMTVRWSYRFKASSIDVTTTVTPITSAGNWVKEPKFSAVAAKSHDSFGGFSQFQVFDDAGKLLGSGAVGPNAQQKTYQFNQPNRARARLSHQGKSCSASSKCLRIEARSGENSNWDSGTSTGNPGLDRWATDANASLRLGASDSGCKRCGTGGSSCRCDQCPAPTSCNACKVPLANDCRLPNGSIVPHSPSIDNDTIYWACGSGLDGIRQWEAAGNNQNDGINPGPGFYFHGWEGGSGPPDCENRAHAFKAGSYSNVFNIDLVPDTKVDPVTGEPPAPSPSAPPPDSPPPTGACSSGARECLGDWSYRQCDAGQWSGPWTCASFPGTVCNPSNGFCEGPSAGYLFSGSSLARGQSWSSLDGRFSLSMQHDGNLVLYQGPTALWSSGTWNSDGQVALMQPDGNFLVKDSAFNTLWATNTWGHAGAYVVVQNDGNLVVYAEPEAKTVLWASNTGGH